MLSINAYELLSPNGELLMTFNLDSQGRPVYALSYKGKEVIRPSHLGLELKREDPNAPINFEYDTRSDVTIIDNNNDLYSRFSVRDVQTNTFDETWQPIWGEESHIRNHYNEMSVTLHQELIAS